MELCESSALRARVLLPLALLCIWSDTCSGQTHYAVCDKGNGKFSVKFRTGVDVRVGPAQAGNLYRRLCNASLRWHGGEVLVVSGASKVDIDALGVDLGLGVPTVAFQIKKSDTDSHTSYQIYSLEKPSRLLRTITGSEYYSAADTDLDGRVEIWSKDGEAVAGFENLPFRELDVSPTIVLRFENQRLLDVSSEFRSYFDHQIAVIRAHLSSRELTEFKKTDGKLSDKSQLQPDRLHELQATKINILEIVWSYLYSDRENDAWNALTQMWPARDLDRIRGAILKARAGGITREIDGVSSEMPGLHYLTRVAHIFRTVPDTDGDLGNSDFYNPSVDVKPQEIVLLLPTPTDSNKPLPKSEETVDLVIDSAGKVRSAKMVGKPDEDLVNATTTWKFIPAFKNDHAVACTLRLSVSRLR